LGAGFADALAAATGAFACDETGPGAAIGVGAWTLKAGLGLGRVVANTGGLMGVGLGGVLGSIFGSIFGLTSGLGGNGLAFTIGLGLTMGSGFMTGLGSGSFSFTGGGNKVTSMGWGLVGLTSVNGWRNHWMMKKCRRTTAKVDTNKRKKRRFSPLLGRLAGYTRLVCMLLGLVNGKLPRLPLNLLIITPVLKLIA
jgi:hypothetical protein